MDPQTVALIGTLSGTSLGVVLGAGASWWQVRRQRGWQLEDFERLQLAARDAEVRTRADAKADEVLDLLYELERRLLHPSRPSPFLWNSNIDAKAAQEALQRLSRASLYLQKPLRRHVELVARVLPDADRMAAENWVEAHPRAIAFTLIRRGRENVARYLRGGEVRIDLSGNQEDYSDAWQRLQNRIEDQLEAQLQETRNTQQGQDAT